MKRRFSVMWSVAPFALLSGVSAATGAEEPGGAALEQAFLEFLAEEAGVDEELSDALMSSDLDRALEQSRRRGEVDSHGKE